MRLKCAIAHRQLVKRRQVPPCILYSMTSFITAYRVVYDYFAADFTFEASRLNISAGNVRGRANGMMMHGFREVILGLTSRARRAGNAAPRPWTLSSTLLIFSLWRAIL